MVLPIRLGGGTRLKILEAFAASRPVITTAKGVEGIDAVDGKHLFVRESAVDIAEAAVSALAGSGPASQPLPERPPTGDGPLFV